MLEVVSHFLALLAGVLVTWLIWAWKHRKLVIAVVDWFIQALKDGRITWREFSVLCKRMGKIAEEYAEKQGVKLSE